MTVDLFRLPLASESDVFTCRQRVREMATLLGFDKSDEIRIATAVSELGREIVSAGQTAIVALVITDSTFPEMSIVATCNDRFDAENLAALGIGASRRLMDAVTIEHGESTVIRLTKVLPTRHTAIDREGINELRRQLEASIAVTPFEELRAQNLELVSAFDQLKAKQDDLARLNEELTETNQGVMAMYSQLSDELSETNRGVVALYAELDQRGVQLREASEAKSRFLANVSHELRSPLNSILAVSRLLTEADSEAMSDSQVHQVELIQSSAVRLLTDVNDLLDLAKAESGRLEPKIATVRLESVLFELRATMAPLAREHVDLILDIETGSEIILETDEALFLQVVRNLVSNALKFTETGSVTISAVMDASSNRIRIDVVDTGIGMSLENCSLIFEEFYQIPNRLQNRFKSTGIGLAYSRRVAEALGGTLQVMSTLDVGSTFSFVLPQHWVYLPEVSPQLVDSVEPLVLESALIVDDESSFRLLLRQMLQGVAGRVYEASNAASALEMMRDHQPDVVLLDLRMSDSGGEDVLLAANAEAALRNIPIAVVTSVDLDGTALLRLNRAFAFINKSELTKELLLAVIGTTRMEVTN